MAPTLCSCQHQARVQHLLLLTVRSVEVGASAHLPVHSGVYGHCIGLQGLGSIALALDLPTFGISDFKGKAKVIIPGLLNVLQTRALNVN